MAGKLFETQKSAKLSLDDTIPLNCVIESGEKVQDHVVNICCIHVLLLVDR